MSLHSEIFALSRMPKKNIYGDTICQAFGYADPEALLRNEMAERDFLFEIEYVQGDKELHLTVDLYSAHLPSDARWDVDEWEAKMIRLIAPSNRSGYLELARAARAMLNGRTVVLPDGTIFLPGGDGHAQA